MDKTNILLKAEIIKSADEIKILTEKDDYYDDLLELEEFFQVYLSDFFKIDNPVFVYGSSRELNAWAWSKNGVNAVCINYSSAKIMRDFFNNFEKEIYMCIDLFHLDRFYSNNLPATQTMTQVSEMFLFFHETFHLIQAEHPMLLNNFTEEEIKDGKFDIVDHISELDADFCASRRMATHILSMLKQEKRYLTPVTRGEYLEDLTIISIIGYMLYRLILNEQEKEFYLKKKSHPHMSIRIAYCMIHITEAINKNTNLPFRKKLVTTTVMTFLEKLAEEIPHYVPITKFVEEGKPHTKSISLYIHELHGLIIAEPATALNKTNKKQNESTKNV